MKVVVEYPERSNHANDNGIQHFSMASLTNTAPDEKDDVDVDFRTTEASVEIEKEDQEEKSFKSETQQFS
jgi:hypothetical protein